ncbi:MAG: hypothetical protein EOP93_05080 [Lysobacteraceae bacterium]|nr:MAG: hypothetical protein EOP93_05080 [Xanthomonadaceae bacterium]
MAYGNWMVAALLAGSPEALADVTQFQRHAVEVEDSAGARQVLRVSGTRYSIPGTPAQIVGKARSCVSRRDSGAGVVSVDLAGGRLVAVSRVEYRHGASTRIVKGRLLVEAGAGDFSVVLSNLGLLDDSAGDAVDEVFVPLRMDADAAWEPALAAVIQVEQALLDCMFS